MILNLSDDTDAIFGRDILPKLGIHLVGVATNWDDNKVLFDDSIDDKEYVPNVSNAGTIDEHAALLLALQPSIEKNQKIDIHSLCNLPEAVVRIDTPEGQHAHVLQYPIVNNTMPVFDEAVKTWFKNGVIKRAPPSPLNSPIVVTHSNLIRYLVFTRINTTPITFAPKKDANGKVTEQRPCIDPQKINILLESDSFSLPLIDDIFMISLVIKTTFTHRNRQYMFRPVSFELKHVSSHFMRMMNLIMNNLPNVHVYFNDIIIGTKGDSMEDHFEAVNAVINRLTEFNMILNSQKCHFDKEMMQWLGAVNYFRSHIPRVAALTAPLDPFRNFSFIDDFKWTPELETHFQSIKDILCSNIVLSPPDVTKPFYVATDASNTGIDAALFQKIKVQTDDGSTSITIRYIGFMARTLSQSECNYSVTRRELLAIVFALKKFHKFLYSNHFTLYSDHRALTYLLTSDELNLMMIGWMNTLLSYAFDIIWQGVIQEAQENDEILLTNRILRRNMN
ncbi:hypothetical protein G6F56_009400 [Rhizopus delemar]|nr:hypothetical protein G6F56_009400 [Rhizopus delemar]